MRFTAAFVLLFVGLAHAQNQLLLIQRVWAASPTTESSDCVEVQTDGSYRFEHTLRRLRAARHNQNSPGHSHFRREDAAHRNTE